MKQLVTKSHYLYMHALSIGDVVDALQSAMKNITGRDAILYCRDSVASIDYKVEETDAEEAERLDTYEHRKAVRKQMYEELKGEFE